MAAFADAQGVLPKLKQSFKVVHTQEMSHEMHIDQEQILMQSNRVTRVHYAVISIHEKGYGLKATTTFLSGKLQALGEEKSFHSNDTSSIVISLSDQDAGKYFFSVSHPKLGYNWVDSTHTDSSKIMYQYLISKITADSIAITVYADMMIHQRVQQNNTAFVQQLKGIMRATRWYNTKNGLLKTEESNTLFTGLANINGSKIPVRVTIKTSLKVEEER